MDELDAAILTDLERHVREVKVAEGTRIFSTNDPADALYLIRAGLVDVLAPGPEGEVRIATLGPGETLGEMGVLTGRSRSAAAVAQTGATLWRLALPDLLRFAGERPAFAAAIAKTVAERLQAASRAGAGLPRGRTSILVADEASALAGLLGPLADACTRLLGERPAVIATGAPEDWGRADLPTGTPVLDPQAAAGEAIRIVREHPLVLVGCVADVPAPLSGANRVITVDPGSEDVDALARDLCGRRVGLVLGSGGIRGFAHAGVLRVLQDEGIPVDVLGGASAGSIACGLILSGWSPHDLSDLGRAIRETLGTGFLPGMPFTPGSFLSGRRLRSFFHRRFGDTLIEDLATTLVLTATDLDTRGPVHLVEGSLADSVAASSAIPGIFPPVRIDDRRLVDGGISDPVPVDAVRAAGADIVIAVNVMSIGKGPLGVYTPRFKIPMPGPLEALFVGLDTVATQLAVKACTRADVVVEPGSADPKWYEVVPTKTYEQAGERAAREALPTIRGLLGG